MTRDNLTLSLNPGERDLLNALAKTDGHPSLAALIRSRLGLAPPRKQGRPAKPSAPPGSVASGSDEKQNR